jgi:hypothetical protein
MGLRVGITAERVAQSGSRAGRRVRSFIVTSPRFPCYMFASAQTHICATRSISFAALRLQQMGFKS